MQDDARSTQITAVDRVLGLNVLLNYLPRRTAWSAFRTVQEHYFPVETREEGGWLRLGDDLQHIWSRGILSRSRTRVVLEGGEHVEPGKRYIVVCNHQSYMDIPVLLATFPCSLRFVAKMELRSIPFFGLALENLRHVFIDRGRGREAYAHMRSQANEAGTSVVIFPEGTRTPDGTLGPFKGGAFHMAVETGFPVLPVAIDGTYDIMPRWRGWLKTGEMVRIRVAPALPSIGRDADTLRREAREVIAGLLEAREVSVPEPAQPAAASG